MSIRQVVCFAHFPVLAVFGYGFGRPPLEMRTRECAFFFRVRIPPLTCRYPMKRISSLNLKMKKEEMEEKAKQAIKASMDAAARIGGMACDLGKKGYEVAREKARELGEKAKEAKDRAAAKREEERRIYAEQVKEAERLAERRLQENPEYVAARRQAVQGVPGWQGDPADKNFLISYGWLYLIWWIGNILYSILCLKWFASALESSWTRDTAWVALVVWALALLLNRLAYEGAVAFFEMVRHLRQIRDELRHHNMREESRGRKMPVPEHETPVDAANAEATESDKSTSAAE